MIIDIIVAILLALAVYKGYRRGVIVAVCSFLSIIIGLAAAMKLSVVVANYLTASGVNGKWITFLSFLIVLVVVIFLVRWIASLVQKLVETILMGWANRLTGVVLYALLYLTFFSVLLFYINKLDLINASTLDNSATYPFIKKLGPFVIDNFGKLIPWFKNMFADLSNFFGGVAAKI